MSATDIPRPKCYVQTWLTVDFLEKYLYITHVTVPMLNMIFLGAQMAFNILILIAIIKNNRIRTPSTLLLGNICIKDLVIASILQPNGIFRSINFLVQDNHCYKSAADDIRPFTVFLYRCVSLATWVMVSIDRWLAVRRASKYRVIFTRKRAYIAIGVGWIYSVVLSYLATFVMNKDQRYLLVLIQFGLTCLIIIYIQINVYRSIKAHGSNIGALTSAQQTQAAIEKRVSITVAYSVIALAISYLPMIIDALLFYFGTNLSLMTSPWCEMLLLANGAINPFIWLKTSEQIRKAVMDAACLPSRMFSSRVAPAASSQETENT
ncbi:trace amine-associated receptor 6 [Nematostella vectensis]|uniref:trace amine-associated receptor 6 n=1 Tax=Nematostella vectensis TaxID=45351 RepID=UPI002077139C|nr:trace amine-associated receptor 6 [Nematostella vectensis]